MRYKILSVLFCLLIMVGAALHLLLPDKYFSQQEKRTLKQFPGLSWSSVSAKSFEDDIEEYLADQFPLRDCWVAVKTIAERLSGKQESGGVYFADDGYLIEIHRSFDEAQLRQNIDAVKRLQDLMDEQGVSLRFLPVPTAGDILREKLPAFAPNANQRAVIALAKQQGLRVVDVTETLDAHKDAYLFYKTDHHWTSLGAYYVWAEWMEDMGRTPALLAEWTVETLTDRFRGTTYAKVNDPFAAFDTIDAYYKTKTHRVAYNSGSYVTDSIYEDKFLDGADQYGVFLNSNQADTVVSGSGTGRLLILKDSYANCFAQFCVDDFQQTHLIDLRFFRGSILDYIAENGITEVLVLYNIPNFAQDTAVSRCGN
ncbi:MAG: hypothetical protein J5789_02450 [Oscillospiraceae bacterium]|nr:hypothetical protein [Oscillospiraceae bacterium]